MFRKEFDKRLFALEEAIKNYRESGNECNVLPRLFKCSSFVWCNNPKLKSYGNKRNKE